MYDYYDDAFSEPEIETNAKELMNTPVATLIQCDAGIAWFPRKVYTINHDDVLYYDAWFEPTWQPTEMSEIEGDFI